MSLSLERFVVDEYNQRTHSETGEAPITRWQAGGWMPGMPVRAEDLERLLLTVAHYAVSGMVIVVRTGPIRGRGYLVKTLWATNNAIPMTPAWFPRVEPTISMRRVASGSERR